ncbi:MAG TPA: hypothetical protein V6D47_06090 [Oscillatoriaceae cyanobacterium]
METESRREKVEDRPTSSLRPGFSVSSRAFWLVLAGLLAATVAFPLTQFVMTGGHIYYLNGFDETAYLQYDYSRVIQGIARPGQYLVTLLHQAGLAGGQINLLLDLTMPLAFVLAARAVLRGLNWSVEQANGGALALLVLPELALSSNPLVHRFWAWTMQHGLRFWFNVPDMTSSPFWRSPEPQFSLLMLALAIGLAVRIRRYWPVYFVLPFMYPFIALPAGFVLLACHTRSCWPWGERWATAGPLLFAYAVLGALSWAYGAFFVGATTHLFLVPTHLPLFSLTGALMLTVYMALCRRSDARWRFWGLALALAPLAVSNHQILAGYIAQPINFERYAGGVLFALMLVTATKLPARVWQVIFAFAMVLYLRDVVLSFRANQAVCAELPLTPALLHDLRRDPDRVVVDDFVVSGELNMLYPREGSTALGLEKATAQFCDRYLDDYLRIRRQVRLDHPESRRLKYILAEMDDGFTYKGLDDPYIRIGRTPKPKPLDDLDARVASEPALKLDYFFVRTSH